MMTIIINPVKILDLTPAQLKNFLQLIDEPTSYAEQIIKYVYREGVATFNEMTGLSLSLRQKLAKYAKMGTLDLVDTHGQSPWHFTVQASLDLNPVVLAT